jgi:hypothetical protein
MNPIVLKKIIFYGELVDGNIRPHRIFCHTRSWAQYKNIFVINSVKPTDAARISSPEKINTNRVVSKVPTARQLTPFTTLRQ